MQNFNTECECNTIQISKFEVIIINIIIFLLFFLGVTLSGRNSLILGK